jgi:RNA polymerase sigma factor (sigma-70 family)
MPTSGVDSGAVDFQSLLVQHLGHIDRVVHNVARRHQLSPTDAEELTSVVRFKLIDKDFAILRKFQGRSAITTYLTIVVERLCLDFFNERWGKWRPSSAARRLGGTAVMLEQLIARDGLTFDEAVSTMQINHGVSESREALLGILVQLPIRAVRRFAGEEELALVAALGGATDPAFDLPEEHAMAARIDAVLEQSVDQLPDRDRLLLRLRYHEDLPVASIARVLDVEPRPLYNRLAEITKELGVRLRREGIDQAQVNRVVGHPAVALGRMLGELAGNPSENDGLRPSNG